MRKRARTHKNRSIGVNRCAVQCIEGKIKCIFILGAYYRKWWREYTKQILKRIRKIDRAYYNEVAQYVLSAKRKTAKV